MMPASLLIPAVAQQPVFRKPKDIPNVGGMLKPCTFDGGSTSRLPMEVPPAGYLRSLWLASPLRWSVVLCQALCQGALFPVVAFLCLLPCSQDFNKEVLLNLTMPNVLANMARMPSSRSKGPAKFFSGDWHSVGELLTSRVGGSTEHMHNRWHNRAQALSFEGHVI